MKSFNEKYIKTLLFKPNTTWFLSQCAEAKGMQEMWKTVRPEVMEKLREFAIIQSSESSNRIEGVEVEKERLIPLVLGKTKPKDRSEEEIVGYRKALNYIHAEYKNININTKTIKKIHKIAQGGMIGDAGKWKERNNDIIEILSSGEKIIRFKPVSAEKTSTYIEQLCLGYQDVINNNKLPDLITISNFILDFLCIHPFRDGNGRVSRLLTLLLLYQHGYEVGRYISVERIIEDTKEDYYEVLKTSSLDWHKSNHNSLPWWHYFLSTIKTAYQELKDRVELSHSGDNMSGIIRQTIKSIDTLFSVSDICKINPNIDRELIKKVIFSMKKENLLELIGKGRGAKWRKK